MNNGRRCCLFYVLIRRLMSAESRNAAASSLPFSGWLAQAHSGDCCRKSTATGTPSTAASPAGLSRASSMSCIRHWLTMPTRSTCLLTRPSSALTRAPQGREKKWRARSASVRQKSRRLLHQDSHRGGCARQSAPIALNCRSTPRQPAGRRFD
jgi:hypothetical protein